MIGTRHAAESGDFVPNDKQRVAVDKLVAVIDRYGLVTPAIVVLEMAKPVNRVLSVFALLAAPSVQILLGTEVVQELGLMLDDRRALEYVLRRLEERA